MWCKMLWEDDVHYFKQSLHTIHTSMLKRMKFNQERIFRQETHAQGNMGLYKIRSHLWLILGRGEAERVFQTTFCHRKKGPQNWSPYNSQFYVRAQNLGLLGFRAYGLRLRGTLHFKCLRPGRPILADPSFQMFKTWQTCFRWTPNRGSPGEGERRPGISPKTRPPPPPRVFTT